MKRKGGISEGDKTLRPARKAVALGILLFSVPGTAPAAPAPGFDSLKALAASMIRSGIRADGAYCESYSVTQVHGCSGGTRSTSRSVLRPDGKVARFQYRSWNEGADPALGEFRGTLSPERWDELLRKIAALEWKEEPGMPFPSAPPSPAQPIAMLKLCDGKRTASYSVSGPTPMSIGTVMGAPDVLADSATDTVWALSLTDARIRAAKKELVFSAKWRARGSVPLTILWPGPGDGNGCGRAMLEWSGDDETSGTRTEDALKSKGKALSWKIKKNGSASMELRFPYPQPAAGKKTGKLREFGVLAKPSGTGEAIPLTFFSDRIRF